MRVVRRVLVAAFLASFAAPANAYEGAPFQQKGGVLIGVSAGVPPPGIYMVNQFLSYQGVVAGPGGNLIGQPPVRLAGYNPVFLFVPGWTFLGGTYDAVLVQPFMMESVGSPANVSSAGLHNTYFANELTWKLGDSGFFAKAGLGVFAPTGTISGPAGTSNLGAAFWTFQPEFFLSYLKDGWNLTAAIYAELNTASTVTQYKSGTILHADFTATKKFGNWTLGPVGYYMGQVSDDKSSAFYNYQILKANRYDVWAVGGLVGYDFGYVTLNVWATTEVYAHASGATRGPIDVSSIPRGWTALASLSYRLWAPDNNPPPKRPQFFK
jgi:hypothetical protein